LYTPGPHHGPGVGGHDEFFISNELGSQIDYVGTKGRSGCRVGTFKQDEFGRTKVRAFGRDLLKCVDRGGMPWITGIP